MCGKSEGLTFVSELPLRTQARKNSTLHDVVGVWIAVVIAAKSQHPQ